MNRRVLVVILIGILSLLALAQSARADGPFRIKEPPLAGQEYVPGEVIVKFKDGLSSSIRTLIFSRLRLALLANSRTASFMRARIPAGSSVEHMVEQLKLDPAVEYAEPNYIAYAYWAPNDEFYSKQWHLNNAQYGGINMEAAWDAEDGDPGVIVAVVDTGVAYENFTQSSFFSTTNYYLAPDLAATRFVAGYDFVNEDTHPNDDEGHGTHVAGTIAQSTNNGIGVAGIAFNCSIMPVKVLNGSGSGSYADVADGIRWAADHGAKVINLSLGGSSASMTLQSALVYALGKGVTIACASGNNGSLTTIGYPAAYDQCLAVGATRYDETVSYYSNRGAALDLVAPGGDTRVDQNLDGWPDGVVQQTFGNALNDWGYYLYQGTSMATPHVAGVAALVIARGLATTPAEVRAVLQSTAEDKGAPGWDSTYGHGIVNAAAALGAGGGTPVPNQPPTANAGADQSAVMGQTVLFNGGGSSDADGSIVSYAWNFGDNTTGTGATPTHAYAAAGSYTVTLTVTDDDTATGSDTMLVTVTDSAGPVDAFVDSFEVGEWNGLWTEDSQNDWTRSTQRATSGSRSAEADGSAADAQLISIPIALQGRTNATITFSWLIEDSLDTGEYLAFDTSTNGGTSWIEQARIRGNVDPENVWRAVTVQLQNIPGLRLRFRARMSSSLEDANLDQVKVVAY